MECSMCSELCENATIREFSEYSKIWKIMESRVTEGLMIKQEKDSLQTIFHCNECGSEWQLGMPDFPLQGYFVRRTQKKHSLDELLYEAYSECELFRFYVTIADDGTYKTTFEHNDCANVPHITATYERKFYAKTLEEAIKNGEQLLVEAEKELRYIYS